MSRERRGASFQRGAVPFLGSNEMPLQAYAVYGIILP